MTTPWGMDAPTLPRWFWPASATAAIALHAGGWLWVRDRWLAPVATQPPVIDLVIVGDAPPPPPTPEGSRASTSPPTPTTETAPSSDAPPTLGELEPNSPEDFSSVANPVPESPTGSTSQGTPEPDRPQPSPGATSPTPPSPTAPSEPNPSLSPAAQTQWSLGLVPNGRDLPDVPPQLPSEWQARSLTTTTAAGCISADAIAALRSLTVGLRLTVETDGQISDIQVWEPSADPAFDQAVVCWLQKATDLRLIPATVAGEAIATDMALLTIRLSGE